MNQNYRDFSLLTLTLTTYTFFNEEDAMTLEEMKEKAVQMMLKRFH